MIWRRFTNKPIVVESSFYDGSEECAEKFCHEHPGHFIIGSNKKEEFAGLFILTGSGGIPVAPEDIIFREVGDGGFCSMDSESFYNYFDVDLMESSGEDDEELEEEEDDGYWGHENVEDQCDCYGPEVTD